MLSPADRAGITRGDVIVVFDGRDVGTVNELTALVAERPVCKTVKIKVLRNGRHRSLA
jgi:serine protease Do